MNLPTTSHDYARFAGMWWMLREQAIQQARDAKEPAIRDLWVKAARDRNREMVKRLRVMRETA